MAGATSMLILAGAQMGATGANAYTQAENIKSEGRYAKILADYNAKVATKKAKESLEAGRGEALQVLGYGRRVEGAQKAAQGASGIVMDFGSAEMTRARTSELAQLDALNIRKKAYLESWGYESQAIQYKYAGLFARAKAKADVRNTLATAGLKMFGQGLTAAFMYQQMNPTVDPTSLPDTIDAPGPVYFDSPNAVSASAVDGYQASLAGLGDGSSGGLNFKPAAVANIEKYNSLFGMGDA